MGSHSDRKRHRTGRRRNRTGALLMVPLVAASLIIGFRLSVPAGSNGATAELSASGTFTCDTDADGNCWVRHGLGVVPVTASVEVRGVSRQPAQTAPAGTATASAAVPAMNAGAPASAARLTPVPVPVVPLTTVPMPASTGSATAPADATAGYLGVPRELRADRMKLSFRTPDGKPVKRTRLRGFYRVYRSCPPTFGEWCRPPVGPTGSPVPTLTPSPPATTRTTATPTKTTPPVPTTPPPAPMSAAPTSAGPQPAAGLVFNDEFDGTAGSPPNSATWSPTVGAKWGVNELECYTSSPNNVLLDGHGHLSLIARREASCGGTSYTSGRVETRDKRSWRYGYFEIRAKMPTGAGMWPAIWMLGPNGITEWPASGETDIVEVVSGEPGRVHTNVHGINAAGTHWEAGWAGPGRSYDYPGGNLADGYHTYGLDWSANALRYYFDGILVRTISKSDVPVWLWDKPFYLILCVAVGSTGGDPARGTFPQEMSVDYVRVYASKPG
jgi:beta-glucanase (GH16 family)